MSKLAKLITIETKLFFRDPAAWMIPIILPALILVILGLVFSPNAPDPEFGGLRFIDLFVPSLVVLTLASLGVSTLPIRLAGYREKGVLRRLSTTPVRPANLLIAQLLISVVAAISAAGLLIAVGKLAFDVPVPRHLPGFVLAFTVGMFSLFAIGLLVGAVAPTTRAGTAYSLPLYFLAMFLGGVYVPRVFLPEFLVTIGDYTPPGVQSLLDAWMGIAPQPLPMVILAAITVVSAITAARLFRWE
ncbi:MAG TPA: ABC transporter permease [Promineifilum sp.]